MPSPSSPDPSRVAAVLTIAERAREHDGQPPFSDQAIVEFRTGRRESILLERVAAAIFGAGEAELVVDPDARGHGRGTALLETLLSRSPAGLLVWSHGDHPAARALATSHGFEPVRTLLQLRAEVPPEVRSRQARPDLAARPLLTAFRPGIDDQAWLALNARAFASHAEQGSVSQADLDELSREQWFDAEDFLLLWQADALLGYCWLKVEDGIGEIYVIGVDPDHQGDGLGRQLMVAGFARLAERGIRTAALYVEGDNAPALALYRSLGFHDHSVDIQYSSKRTR